MKLEIRSGENQGGHKLTDSDIDRILALFAAGQTRKQLAARFGVSAVLIGKVLNGQRGKTQPSWRY